ncbi:MAG TPA: hypothetical protein DDW54_00410 [Clostridiales bacterium]|nr:hypothetical protein [Clostridiales bacterium]
MIKPEYGALKCVAKKHSEVKVNAESVLPVGAEVKKPISVSAQVFPLGQENKEASTTVKGKVVFCFVYLAEEGYKKVESATDIMADLALVSAEARFTVEDVRAVAGGDGYTARCAVRISGDSLITEDKNALAGGENVLVKEITETFDVHTGITRDTFTVTDEFELDRAALDVLSYGAASSVTKTEAGVGKITAEGEVVIRLKTIGGDTRSEITSERRTVPFRLDLENSGTLPDMRASAKIDVTKVNLKVFTDEDKNKSTVNVEISLDFSGEGVAEEKIAIAEDAYSGTDETTVKKSELKTEIFVGQYEKEERISGDTGAEIESGSKIVGFFGEKATVYSCKQSDGEAVLSGAVSADVVIRNSDNGLSVTTAELPFSFGIAGDGINISYIIVSDLNVNVKDGKIRLDATLKTGYKSFIDKKISYIEDVVSSGDRITSDSAISVFIPKCGDGLWEISKELGVSGEEITKNNPELVFPLTGTERVLIYRMK